MKDHSSRDCRMADKPAGVPAGGEVGTRDRRVHIAIFSHSAWAFLVDVSII